jgi:hypothetical protein
MSPRKLRFWQTASVALLPIVFAAATASAQGKVTTPKEFFGHNIGDDYFLPITTNSSRTGTRSTASRIACKSSTWANRPKGRPQLAAIITSPENFKLLSKYKDISMKLAKGEGLTDAQARAMAKEGKSVVWFDGGLHATEVLGANQLIETTYQLISRNDEETMRLLRDDIILAVHANPDGMQLVADWYMKDKDTLQRSMNIPRPLQQVRGARRQSRLVHVESRGDEEHQSSDVLGLAPGDHVQPSPDWSSGNRDVLAAVP